VHIELNTTPGTTQDLESLTVTTDDGRTEQMRLHEYDRVYAVPGLYEEVVQRRLECASPRVLAESLVAEVRAAGEEEAALKILDLGAGNGVVGEELRRQGVREPLVGLDTSRIAPQAAERDRPGLYERYLTEPLDAVDVAGLVAEHGLTCLAGAGALGIGHVTRAQIASAWAAFGPGAWLAVTFPEDILGPAGGELGEFVQALRDGEQDTQVLRLERFRHRLRMSGEPLHYYVLVARRAPA
jgi:trans-aconitate methyltransferase